MGNNSGDMKRNHKQANRTMITKDKSITALKKLTYLFLFRCAQQQLTKLARWFFIVFVTTYTPRAYWISTVKKKRISPWYIKLHSLTFNFLCYITIQNRLLLCQISKKVKSWVKDVVTGEPFAITINQSENCTRTRAHSLTSYADVTFLSNKLRSWRVVWSGRYTYAHSWTVINPKI